MSNSPSFSTPRSRVQKLAEDWSGNQLVPVRVDDLRELLEHPVSDLILLSLFETARGWTASAEEFIEVARGLAVGRIDV